MSRIQKYPAEDALAVIDGPLTLELGIHRIDGTDRTKCHLFAVGGASGRQFAVVLGNTDTRTGRHPALQTRIILEACVLPVLPGIEPQTDPYQGSRVKQLDSKLPPGRQTSCLVADETTLVSLLRWYAGNEYAVQAKLEDASNLRERTRVEKAAADAGFDITPVFRDGRLEFRSSAFPQTLGVHIQPAEIYRLGFSDPAWGQKVAEDCGRSVFEPDGVWPVGLESVSGFDELHLVLTRAARLARLCSEEPLSRFRARAEGLPSSTEAERLVVQRVGQDIFREVLIEYWQGRCAVTGLDLLPVLRASHIKPWAECASDEERLDVFNGLLLAPHLDALFDGHWISFADDGRLLTRPGLTGEQKYLLGLDDSLRLRHVAPGHLPWLALHREAFKRLDPASWDGKIDDE